jgi:hypothetical protein
MACQLYTQDDLTALYSVVYGEILDRINNPSLGQFDKGAFDNLIKTVYEELKDNPDNALLYAQAVPDIFNLVANEPEISKYLIREVKFDFNYPKEKSLDFEDIEEVKKVVTPKQETFNDVENKLKEINKTKNDVVISDDTLLGESELQARNGAKIEYPNRTTLQISVSQNPSRYKKEDDRDVKDPNKQVMATVQKNITTIIKFRSLKETDVVYNGVPIVLSAIKASAFPDKHKLPEHKVASDEESVGVFAVITDKEGNFIYFDKEGNITNEENGSVVYTFLRKVAKTDGNKLTLLYHRTLGDKKTYTFTNTLVDAAVLAEREAQILIAQGGEIMQDAIDQRAQEILEEQTMFMNALYKLRQKIEESDEPIMLEITGGSLGMTSKKITPVPFNKSGFSKEFLSSYIITTDKNNTKNGWGVITVNIDTPIGSIPQEMLLQRGDFNEALAEKVSTALTTKAKFSTTGKELDAQQRLNFFEVFVDNKPNEYSKFNRENILVKINDVDGLVVTIKDYEGKVTEFKGDALYTEEAKQVIKAHLKKREVKGGIPYSVSVHFNKGLKDDSFTDYSFDGNSIKATPINYIDFVQDFAKIQYDQEYFNYLYGNNPYLTYEFPTEFLDDSEYAIFTEGEPVETAPKQTKEEQYKENRTPAEPVEEPVFEEELELMTDETVDSVDISDYEDFLDSDFDSDEFERNLKLGSILDKLFTTKADRERAEEWWKNSPLSKYISLERITQIVNSNAFATFHKTGITLYEGDGGTSVDLYHEAWHGFSQLFLTKQEKINLYNKLKALPEYANKSYLEIEEAIAEDFRDYAKSKGRKEAPKGILGKIFQRIYNFLDTLFGKTTKEQRRLRPRDIASVKEYFDQLYGASTNPELMQNMLPIAQNAEFTHKLNRAKLVKKVKEYSANYTDFTESESLKAASLIDSILPKIFMTYNKAKENSAGVIKILQNNNNRVAMYNTVRKRLITMFENVKAQAAEIAISGEDVPDYILSNQVFLDKVISNFGDPLDAVEGKQKTGVIAYHLENSRFKILSNSYSEVENDPTDLNQSQTFKLDGGNTMSSKDEASEATKTILSSIYKVDRSKFSSEMVDGVKKFNIEFELNEFGEPILVDFNIMWNKLAKILAGSFDKTEMYSRLNNAIESEPEIRQLLQFLPNPSKEYADVTEFNIDVNFWQDLKKPRIAYVQLNVNAEPIKKGEAVYDTTVGTADFDTSAVIRDWNYGFVMDDPRDNEFLVFNDLTGKYVLDTEKVFKTFTDKKGDFKLELSKDFLNAIGIKLDYTNKAIRTVTDNPNFGREYGIDQIFNTIRSTVASPNVEARFAAANPIKYIMEGITKDFETNAKINVSNTRVKTLAKLQARNSDKYSNFSALSPEGNRVWEHFLDSSVTRKITSINHAKSWQELTRAEADPNNKFQHMRWLSEDINPYSMHSQLLGSIFNLKDKKRPSGERLNNNLLINNVDGTQLIEKRKDAKEKKEGVSTASMDATSKFLQEVHTMLMSGVEEFMRHASKQMAQGLTVSGKIDTGTAKKDQKLYVDISNFTPTGFGDSRAFDIIVGYIMAESNRVFKASLNEDKIKKYSGYNRPVERKDTKNTPVMAAQAFAIFDDVLTEETQKKLYDIIDKAVDENNTAFDMMDVINSDNTLRAELEKNVTEYFQKLTAQNIDKLEQAKYLDSGLRQRVPGFDRLSNDQVDETLMKAYTYNSWIHKVETAIIVYGDLAQYNHAKEEFHKRNAGFGSGGRGFSADLNVLKFVNSLPTYYADRFNLPVRPYDGTLRTAIIEERKVDSIYYQEYYDAVYEDYFSRLKDANKAKELTEIALGEYKGMKIGDGQGHIGFEAYRRLKNLEGSWLPEQEELYKKIAKGEEVNVADIVKFFPPYKLQYTGNIQSEILPVTSFHKFSLAPIIPGVAKEGTPLYDLHMKMMEDKIDYVVYGTGSKIAHLGTGDKIFDENNKIIPGAKFTENVIFTEFLKNQTEVNSEYKGKSIFSTQMRKLILDNLYENGEIKSKTAKPIVENYLKHVGEYTELVKLELLEEIGYDEVTPGEYVPRDKDSISKLLELIRANLEREDAYGNELIDFIDAVDSGELAIDLSYHPEVLKIEKVLLSMINKRIIKQKIKGEPLVQVSSSMYENNVTKTEKFRNATDEEKKKWVGSNLLPTYHKKTDGKTAAMKVMIALQGDYENLLNLEYKGKTIGDIDTLNKAIKDDEWLDVNDGANRKAITLVGVRIPVQGLNSMEFMEVYEFLPAQAGNIIIPPAEIVAKSGGDFDIDKLTIFMTNIGLDGQLIKPEHADIETVKQLIKEKNANGESLDDLFKMQKAGLENELIKDVKAILELPENFVSLITPNGTFLLKETADMLSEHVMEYNPKATLMTEAKKGQISPTRVLETMYNLYKHESNIVGKATLGLGAIENTFNILMNSIGASVPKKYTSITGKDRKETVRDTKLFLRHRTMNVNGEERISLSNIYDVDNLNKIADVFSQAMNGWVDVEKDAWIFFIQGNYEVAPILLYLVKTGVPVKEAIYFVSQPLVREYVAQQRLIGSTFAPMLGKSVDGQGLVKYKASREVIAKFFPKNILSPEVKSEVLLNKADEILEKVFKDREDKHFTEKGMLKLIEDSAKDPSKKSKEVSLAMFLHFLSIEDQIKGLTQIKMNANPDTNTRSTLTNIELSENTLSELVNDEFSADLINGLMNDSVISSFFNGPLALALSRPLFKLRYNKTFSDYLITLKKSRLLDESVRKTFGEGNEKNYINAFRNDFVSYLFQNAIMKSKLGDSYMSYSMKETLDVKDFESKYFGAYVKTNANGSKTLFVNDNILKEQFDNNEWSIENTDDENPYSILGLHQLPQMTFAALEKGQNYEQYKRFVIEREYLRSILPKEESQSKEEYEKFLAEKALDNTFNFYHLFNNQDTAYANRITKLINDYPFLARKFDVLSVLKSETDINQNIFNLGIADRDINSTKANMYISNLKDLTNPVILKTFARELKINDADIKRITDTFSMLPVFAYLQTGINKSSYNLVPFVDYTAVIDIIQDAGNKAIEILNGDSIGALDMLNDYRNKFEFANNIKTNPFKKNFRNYLTNFNADDFIENQPTQPQAETNTVKTVSEPYGVVSVETNPTDSITKKFISLIQPQIKKQAYQENVTGNKMFMYGLRWTRKSKAIAPLNNKSYANKGLPITDARAKDGYVYDTVDQNGKPLAPISDLQPIIDKIQNTLGIDMSNYDAVIGNIYLPGQRIATHRDTTESLSARNYPVVVYTIGAGNAINIYENIKQPGSASFASDKKIEIPTKDGTIYTFGMDGKGRFELGHDTPHAIAKGDTLEPITMPDGTVIKDYTITLTFRRAADLEPGMPSAPDNNLTAEAFVESFTKEVKALMNLDSSTDLIETNQPNVFLYDSADKKPDYYNKLTSKNSKVIFLHTYSYAELEAGMNKNFTDQSILQLYASDMTIPIVTSLGKDDNLQDLNASEIEEIKNVWSNLLTTIANVKEKNGVIALPTTGIGNSKLMPQELFVYLSRELYEKLGYLNPGSLLHEEINNLVVSKQGISDEEILQTYGFESDPFKCS